MTLCAKDGACLGRCVKIARAACQKAERDCPRTGPGRKPEVPDWMIATMIAVAILHRKKSRLAQFAFWQARADQFLVWFPGQRMLAQFSILRASAACGGTVKFGREALGILCGATRLGGCPNGGLG